MAAERSLGPRCPGEPSLVQARNGYSPIPDPLHLVEEYLHLGKHISRHLADVVLPLFLTAVVVGSALGFAFS
jgi:hypothetical protein